jgi:hypothetical protein
VLCQSTQQRAFPLLQQLLQHLLQLQQQQLTWLGMGHCQQLRQPLLQLLLQLSRLRLPQLRLGAAAQTVLAAAAAATVPSHPAVAWHQQL